ncbi:MAG TPA: hypothetical protein VKE70_09170 [Candidatus Solibacter sp.]|nr:hypothetical protein [Candidatus Solibacter sp.]
MVTDRLRTPLFVIAAILMVIAVLVELGSSVLIPAPVSDPSLLQGQASDQLKGYSDDDRKKMTSQLISDSKTAPKPPGMAIHDMAVLDGLVCFMLAVILLGDLSQSIWGRTQGIVTLIVSILVLLACIGFIIARFVKVLIMIALLTATPFGTLAYLAMWGFFNRGGASVALSVLMALKIAFVIFLVLSQQRFLQNKGLVLIIVTSLVSNIVISFLQGLVPVFLVSITDGIAAIIVLILAAIWAILMLIFSIPSIFKAVF